MKRVDDIRCRLEARRHNVAVIHLATGISQSALNTFIRDDHRVPRADNLDLIDLALTKLESQSHENKAEKLHKK